MPSETCTRPSRGMPRVRRVETSRRSGRLVAPEVLACARSRSRMGEIVRSRIRPSRRRLAWRSTRGTTGRSARFQSLACGIAPDGGPGRFPTSVPRRSPKSQISLTMPRNPQPVRLPPELSRPLGPIPCPGTLVATVLRDSRLSASRRIGTPFESPSSFHGEMQRRHKHAGRARPRTSGALSKTCVAQSSSRTSEGRESLALYVLRISRSVDAYTRTPRS